MEIKPRELHNNSKDIFRNENKLFKLIHVFELYATKL